MNGQGDSHISEGTKASGNHMGELLDMLDRESGKCISCGFCDSVCPTYEASGHDPAITARGRAQLGKRLYSDLSSSGTTDLPVMDSFYSCLDCHACLQVCPTGVDAGKVSQLGRRATVTIRDGIRERERPEARMMVAATMKYNNPLGVREECSQWADGVNFDTGSDTYLYTGNMYQLMAFSQSMKGKREKLGSVLTGVASRISSHVPSLIRAGSKSYDESVMGIMAGNLRNIVSILEKSGVSFNYMGPEEPYPGTFLHDLGYEREFTEYARRVASMLHSRGCRRIITVDPHTHELLRDVYPTYVPGFDFEVVYYLDLVDRSLVRHTGEEVVFHEPCHFILSGNSYEVPRKLLSEISDVRMPERSGKRTFCCGGPAELLFADLSEKISNERFRQLKEAGGEKIVTACPICLVNLSKDSSVHDISEMVMQAMP